MSTPEDFDRDLRDAVQAKAASVAESAGFRGRLVDEARARSSLPPARGRRWLPPLLAAAAVVLVGSGVAAVKLTEGRGRTPAVAPTVVSTAPPPTSAMPTSPAPSSASSSHRHVVRPSQAGGSTHSTHSTNPPAGAPTTRTRTSPRSGQPCVTSNLSLSFVGGAGLGGTSYANYRFTNRGSVSCTLYGYPGVSIVDASGRTVQHPAGRRTDQPERRVTLRPHGAAYFVVTSVDNTPNSDCRVRYHGVALRVYPPGNTAAVYLTSKGGFCDLGVGAVTGKPSG